MKKLLLLALCASSISIIGMEPTKKTDDIAAKEAQEGLPVRPLLNERVKHTKRVHVRLNPQNPEVARQHEEIMEQRDTEEFVNPNAPITRKKKIFKGNPLIKEGELYRDNRAVHLQQILAQKQKVKEEQERLKEIKKTPVRKITPQQESNVITLNPTESKKGKEEKSPRSPRKHRHSRKKSSSESSSEESSN
jgi:hypothetical protein